MYKKIKLLSTQTGVSQRTLWRRVAELEEERERYPKAVIRDEGIVLVNEDALMDFMYYRTWLRDRNLRKEVPKWCATR